MNLKYYVGIYLGKNVFMFNFDVDIYSYNVKCANVTVPKSIRCFVSTSVPVSDMPINLFYRNK